MSVSEIDSLYNDLQMMYLSQAIILLRQALHHMPMEAKLSKLEWLSTSAGCMNISSLHEYVVSFGTSVWLHFVLKLYQLVEAGNQPMSLDVRRQLLPDPGLSESHDCHQRAYQVYH